MLEEIDRLIQNIFSVIAAKWINTPETIAEIITNNNNRSTKARELLLTDTLTSDEYKVIKSECDEAIIGCKAELKELENKVSHDPKH